MKKRIMNILPVILCLTVSFLMMDINEKYLSKAVSSERNIRSTVTHIYPFVIRNADRKFAFERIQGKYYIQGNMSLDEAVEITGRNDWPAEHEAVKKALIDLYAHIKKIDLKSASGHLESETKTPPAIGLHEMTHEIHYEGWKFYPSKIHAEILSNEPTGEIHSPPLPPFASGVLYSDVLSLTGDHGLIFTVGRNGKIEKGPGLSNDKASQKFLDTLARVYPRWLASACDTQLHGKE